MPMSPLSPHGFSFMGLLKPLRSQMPWIRQQDIAFREQGVKLYIMSITLLLVLEVVCVSSYLLFFTYISCFVL